MFVKREKMKDIVVVRLNPGDDILEKLREAAKENNIQNALILSGVGSVISHHFHVVASRKNPPEEYYMKGDTAADIVNINGAIINGRIHAHITFTNDQVAYGGHLELGNEVLTFAVITIMEIDENFDQFDSIGDIEKLRSDL